MDERTLTSLAKYAVNPVVGRVAGLVPWYALLEPALGTTGGTT